MPCGWSLGVVVLFVASSTSACGKKAHDAGAAEAMAKMSGFRDAMCTCKDKACADRVQAAMTAWSTEMAGKARPNEQPSESELEQLTEIGMAYATCLRQATSDAPGLPEPASGSGDGSARVPTTSITYSMPADHPTVQRLIFEARVRAGADQDPDLGIGTLTASYVRSTGELDAVYGELQVEFVVDDDPIDVPADDPARPIGAPLPPPPPPRPTKTKALDRCLQATWTSKQGWTWGEQLCLGSPSQPRCSLAQVWERALKQRAPANALAVLELRYGTWQFSIQDAPRNVDIKLELPDDCTPVVEKQP